MPRETVRAAGPILYRLVMGAAFMLGVAASIEGFWSASDAPRELKFAFGVVQVVVVTAWLLRSSLNKRNRGVVIDGFREHRLHNADVVHDGTCMRQ